MRKDFHARLDIYDKIENIDPTFKSFSEKWKEVTN